MADVFCRGEGREFPEDEFTTLPSWGLCHTKNVDKRHTIGGSFIDEDNGTIELPELDLPGAPPPRE